MKSLASIVCPTKDSTHAREPVFRRLPTVGARVGDVGAGHEHEVVGEVVQPAAEIPLGGLVENRSHRLDVLLRHRLLRQAGGFEGFLPSQEHPRTLKPAGRDLEYLRGFSGNVNAAFGPMGGPFQPHHHCLIPRSHIDDCHLQVAENAGLILQMGSDGIPAPHHSRVGKVWGIVEFVIL